MDNFFELFFKGGEVTGLGMIAIFAIIAIIFFVIKGLGVISAPSKKPAKVEAKKEEVLEEPEVTPVTEEAEEISEGYNPELIAILAAAISAYSGEPTSKFRVVSFKHIK